MAKTLSKTRNYLNKQDYKSDQTLDACFRSVFSSLCYGCIVVSTKKHLFYREYSNIEMQTQLLRK